MPTAIREKISSAVMNVGRFSEIEIAASLLNRLRDSVLEGYTPSRRGSVDVGGLLYGRVEHETLVLEDSRPIDCEHLLGPRFVLSEADENKLAQLLSRAQADSNLKNLQPVGWYCSHSRSDLLPSLEDTIFADKFFAKNGAVTLILKPDNAVTTSAALHIRQADGSLLNNAADLITISTTPSRQITLPVRRLDGPGQEPVQQSVTDKLVRADRNVAAEPPANNPATRPVALVPEAAIVSESLQSAEPVPEPLLDATEIPKPRKWIKQPVLPVVPETPYAAPADEDGVDSDEIPSKPVYRPQAAQPSQNSLQAKQKLGRDALSRKPVKAQVDLRRRNGLIVIAGVALIVFLVAALALWRPWTGAAGNTAALKLELEPRGTKLIVKWSDGPSTASNAVLTLQEGTQSRTVPLTDQYAPSGFTSIQPKDQSVKATLHVYGKAGEQVAYASYRLPFPLQASEPNTPNANTPTVAAAPPDKASNAPPAATASAPPASSTTTEQTAPEPKKPAPVRRRGW